MKKYILLVLILSLIFICLEAVTVKSSPRSDKVMLQCQAVELVRNAIFMYDERFDLYYIVSSCDNPISIEGFTILPYSELNESIRKNLLVIKEKDR